MGDRGGAIWAGKRRDLQKICWYLCVIPDNTAFCEERASEFAVTDGFLYFSFLYVVLFALFLS